MLVCSSCVRNVLILEIGLFSFLKCLFTFAALCYLICSLAEPYYFHLEHPQLIVVNLDFVK